MDKGLGVMFRTIMQPNTCCNDFRLSFLLRPDMCVTFTYFITAVNSTFRLNLNVICDVLKLKKVLQQSVFDLYPLTYMCVNVDFRLLSDQKTEKLPLKHKKQIYVVVITFFSEICFRCSVIDGYSNPTDDN